MRADKPRSQSGVRDMILSLAVVLGFVALGWVAFVPRGGDAVQVVDPAPTFERAAAQAPYTPLAPRGLGDGWRPTSARLDDLGVAGSAGIHVGYVTPSDDYAQLRQGAGDAALLVDRAVDGAGAPLDDTQIGGRTWESRRTGAGEQALVWYGDGHTVTISGSADWAELAELAAALEPVDG